MHIMGWGIEHRLEITAFGFQESHRVLARWGKSDESALFHLGRSENALAFSFRPMFPKSCSRAKKLDSDVKLDAGSENCIFKPLALILRELWPIKDEMLKMCVSFYNFPAIFPPFFNPLSLLPVKNYFLQQLDLEEEKPNDFHHVL